MTPSNVTFTRPFLSNNILLHCLINCRINFESRLKVEQIMGFEGGTDRKFLRLKTGGGVTKIKEKKK
eukprot:UN07172